MNPEKEKQGRDSYRDERERERRRERREKKRAEERERKLRERDEYFDHERKMSKLEASLHELYPTSQITRQECQEEEPISLYKKWSNGDIPIEKLLTDGVDQLSESELLAIIMGNGPKEFPSFKISSPSAEPGSQIPGVPASETNATFPPLSSN